MKTFKKSKMYLLFVVLSSSALLSACGGGSSDPTPTPQPPPTPPPVPMTDFRVTVTNLTANQPLSPIAVVLHSDGWQSFTAGESASVELEQLAESGSPADLIAAAEADTAVSETANGSSPLPPGMNESFDLTVETADVSTLQLSVVTMLVNTNDAITVINSADVSGLEAMGMQSMNALSYDSGTEANTETAATIPGPVASGEGFNAARDDVRDEVHIHPGVITSQDGMVGSVLDGTHKWDNPVMRVVIERVN